MSGRGRQWETEREVRSRRKREQEEWALHGGYMNAKIQKLINKYDSDKGHEESQDDSESQSKLFSNVAVFVNGYTEPSFDVLRQLMIENGGRYEHYYSASRVTHVIANSLALSKQRLFINSKVVRPSWITDSVEKNELQPYEKYLLLGGSRITKYFSKPSEVKEDTGEAVAHPPSELNSSNEQPEHSDLPSTSSAAFNPPPSTSTASTSSKVVQSNASMLKADQPGFVTEFYGYSRLHHLSHWRTHLKDMVNDIRADPNHKLTGREKLLESSSQSEGLSPLDRTTPVYMHLDMDCFFVSVALRDHPELANKPVAVAHSKGDPTSSSSSFGSMSQIASCNYPAREAGIRNGMMMGKAKDLCPQLTVLPYTFDSYSQVSTLLYHTVASYTTDIEAVSCDELYIDITSLLHIISFDDFAQRLRDEIRAKTRCPCSAGAGGNLLLARMATRKAKPDGQYYVSPELVSDFMAGQRVQDLPGVGRATSRCLQQLEVSTCAELQAFSLPRLRKEFGAKTGENLYKLCRGKDERCLRPDQPRQSVSCDINYGIRLTTLSEVHTLMRNVSSQVQSKLVNAGLVGKQVTLKVKVRSADAPVQSAKFMGHGICESLSKSSGLASATSDSSLIFSVCCNLWRGWSISPADLRGVGIQITKLEKTGNVKSQSNISTFIKKSAKLPSGLVSHDSARKEVSRPTGDVLVPTAVPEVPSLCLCTNTKEIKSILRRWLTERADGPGESDAKYLMDYMISLVKSHHLDTAQDVYIFIYRLTRNVSKPAWREFSKKLKSVLVEEVFREYQATIELPTYP